MPFPCGGSSGVLSGLFFGGIICYLPILSACVGFLVPSRNRQRTIPLLQGMYRACAGRFPGVGKLAPRPGFCAVLGGVAGRGGIGPGGRVGCPGQGTPIWAGICRRAGAGIPGRAGEGDTDRVSVA